MDDTGGLAGPTATATAVTRWIVFPAAVTGVAADTWNVTGDDVARGVASRRKGKPGGKTDISAGTWDTHGPGNCRAAPSSWSSSIGRPFEFQVLRDSRIHTERPVRVFSLRRDRRVGLLMRPVLPRYRATRKPQPLSA